MTIIAAPLVGDVAKVYRTLGDLRSELNIRLGKGAMGAGAGTNQQLVDSHLRTAQSVLYQDFTWHTLIRYQDAPLGVGQYRMDYPSFMDAERLLQVGVNIGTGSENWAEVRRGINMQMYNTLDNRTYPRRFEQYDQIEFWPKADRAYTLRIWGVKALARFTEDNDRAMIDDDLVFLWALATLKAHYGQKDAQVVGNQVEKLRVRLRDRSWKQRVFDANLGAQAGPDWDPLPKPVVIGR